jgi:hypothetical protein
MRSSKLYGSGHVAMMFREFGVDMAAHMANVRDKAGQARALDEMRVLAKKRFKELALGHHPDRNNGDDAEFKRINGVWQTIENLQPAPPPPRPNANQHTVTIVFGGVTTTGATATTGGGWWP